MTEKNKIRVALADDIEVVRRSMAAVLSQDAAIEVVGTAENGRQLISLCEKENPDVAVVDIRMPVMDGIEVTKWLRKHMPEIRILILTTFDDEEYIHTLLSIGINGYILKGGDDAPLISAVKSVYMGVNTLAPAILNKLSAMLQPGHSRQDAREPEAPLLSDVERKVAALIAKNYYNKDIAVELSLNYGVVRNIVSRIYRKLGVTERDLVREFISEEQPYE